MFNISKAFEYIDNFSKLESVTSTLILGYENNQEIEITIAIPTYKRSKTIQDTIQSAISQTGFSEKDYEILIVDNDAERNCETEQLIRESFSDQQNLRYYKNQENLGLLGNWNRCFELAKGKWVLFLHDDDFIYPEYLERTIPIIHLNKDISILKPLMKSWVDDGKEYQRKADNIKYKSIKFQRVKPIDYIFLGNYVGAPTGCLLKRKAVIDIGGFNLDLLPGADTVAMLYIASKSKVYIMREILGVQRIGINESLKHEMLKKFMISRFNIISFLIKKYKIKWLLNSNYKYYSLTIFEKEIQQGLSATFSFDYSILGSDAHRVNTNTLAKALKWLYAVYKKMHSGLNFSVKNR